jgi:hypothetical protein
MGAFEWGAGRCGGEGWGARGRRGRGDVTSLGMSHPVDRIEVMAPTRWWSGRTGLTRREQQYRNLPF